MRILGNRFFATIVVLAAAAFLAACNPPNYPTGTIELKYYAMGPSSVTVQAGGGCCDSLGNKFDFYYPSNLITSSSIHPILTWGNGTLGKPGDVDYFLRHMASWGFVIVATEDQNTGPGVTILDAAKYMVARNADATSIFHGKLDTANVGAIGHSQGANGAINAMLQSTGLIKTVIPIELPKRSLCLVPGTCAEPANLTSGSIFFVDGSLDTLISPPTQPPATPGEESIEAYYNATPATIQKMRGTLIGPTHNDVTGQPSCKKAKVPCLLGVYGYLGYPTAWMMDRLQGDSYAHGAFVNATGEMFTETQNWQRVAGNIP